MAAGLISVALLALPPAAHAAIATVEVKDFAFQPSTVTVAAGAPGRRRAPGRRDERALGRPPGPPRADGRGRGVVLPGPPRARRGARAPALAPAPRPDPPPPPPPLQQPAIDDAPGGARAPRR